MAELSCEWPHRIGGHRKCGRTARYLVTQDPNPAGWKRPVCGTHRRRALTLGWWEPADVVAYLAMRDFEEADG